ncbi:ABC transporter substrate-binding protein [Paracoccus sulfuroxidans]|uniref:Peptide/nickel transport system substrate-binding protein n=1 Tax=Paracoccus sulfuroxidans TaxID=384678 RepID=A0A562NHI2_9RHOB|nr:ABC transporter substrate-binding protein [Paracoccus sulfuroxidans]TWI31548.1 peptide/nickel transport system substrate-binding protein [Paracoccus sulfuroxidans]
MNDINQIKARGGPALSRRMLLAGAAGTAMLPLLGRASLAQSGPQKGGTLRVAMGQANTAESLDPGTYATSMSIAFAFCRGNALCEYSPSDEIVGELAESWEASSDAKTWTFKLRKGVTFHNGKPLTAEDVVATFDYHRGENSTSGAKALLSDLANVRAEDDQTVVFELSSGNADFPSITADFHLIILPSDGKGGLDIASGAGTGAYKISSLEPGVRIELERNPDYWKPNAAHFDAIHLIAVLDAAARNNAVVSGQVDVAERNDTATLAMLAQAPNIIIDETPSAAHNNFAMACTMAPFTDPNIRLAMKYGIDREDVLRKTQFGHGYVGNDHPIARSNKYFNTELEQTAYDPDKARHYLKQAGLDKLDVELITSEGAAAGAVPAAELYSASAAACGINIAVRRVPGDGYFSDIWLKSPFAASDWGGRPTADLAFTVAYAKDAPWNETHWQNERFNELLVTARTELDEDRRRTMYWEMQELCNRDGGAIVLNFQNWIVVRSKKIAHDEAVSAQWPLDGYKAFERWWFAA